MCGRRALRWLLWLVLAPAVVLVAACPDREVLIDFTSAGVELLAQACAATGGGCPVVAEAGQIPAPGKWSRSLNLKLWLVEAPVDGTGYGPPAATSDCMFANLDCSLDEAECLASGLDDVLAKQLSAGIGYDGLKDPASEVLLIMTLHNPDSGGHCTADNLFACAGLARRKHESYDITCAGCNNTAGLGPNRSPPCQEDCFFKGCYDYVKGNGD